MTITEYIQSQDVGKTKLYRKLKEAGLTADELREPGSPHLSVQGLQTLAALFDDERSVSPVEDVPEESQTTERTSDVEPELLTASASSLTVEVAVLRERVEGLQRENDLLRENLAKAESIAQDWQKRYDDSNRLLLSSTEHRSIWSRIFRHRKGESQP